MTGSIVDISVYGIVHLHLLGYWIERTLVQTTKVLFTVLHAAFSLEIFERQLCSNIFDGLLVRIW